MKYILQPATSDFLVETTDLRFCVNERSGLSLTVEVIKNNFEREDPSAVSTLEVVFPLFAKLEYTMMNFWEQNYNNFEINSDYIKAGFFYVKNSNWNKIQYDPLNRFNLNHFLIVGYDSYLEILANENFKLNFLID